MKLLSVVPSYWPAFQFGGPIFSVHNLNKSLASKGIDVTVYTTNAGLEGMVPPDREIPIDGVKVTYFSFSHLLDFIGTSGWQFSLPMTRALKSTIIDFDIVYIVALWNFPIAASSYFCRKAEKPYIISPRGLLYPYTFQNRLWKKFPYFHLIAKRDLKCASAIHYTTLDEFENCHSTLGLTNQALVIPNGIDLSEFKNQWKKDGFIKHYNYLSGKRLITFLGRINWKKGLDILIKSFAMLSKQMCDVHLMIAGNDDEGYGRRIKKLINEYGMGYLDYGQNDEVFSKDTFNEVKVTFTGMLSGREKLELLSCSDLFALPSYSENFGMSVVEAMACGTPVVISNKVGIHKEVREKSAGIVVEANPDDLLSGIKTLLNDDKLRKITSENGKLLAKDTYDIDNIASVMVNALENILIRESKSN